LRIQAKGLARPSIRMLIVGYATAYVSSGSFARSRAAPRLPVVLPARFWVFDHSTFSVNRHGRFRNGDILRQFFEAVVPVCMGGARRDEFQLAAIMQNRRTSKPLPSTSGGHYQMGRCVRCMSRGNVNVGCRHQYRRPPRRCSERRDNTTLRILPPGDYALFLSAAFSTASTNSQQTKCQ
jgi:hypothetical protein